MIVYGVAGVSGRYSVHLWWIADAWYSKEEAEQRIVELKESLVKVGYNKDLPWKYLYEAVERMAEMEGGDPNIKWNSNSTHIEYFIITIELVGLMRGTENERTHKTYQC